MYTICMLKIKMLMTDIKRDKEMEIQTVFKDWKTQHNKDVNSPQIDL